MKPVLVLATENAHKVDELRAILGPLLPEILPAQIVPMSHFDVCAPVEDGLTFKENSLIKARAVAKATNLPAIADDSGIQVDALGSAPGVFSARWAGRHGDDRANYELLLAQLVDVKQEDRGAAFTCAASLAFPDGQATVVEGIWPGRLAHKAHGGGGFGYDPVFVPEGFDVTSAELEPGQKNAISHRVRAFTALAPYIREQVLG